jgi:hypothetical protein
METLKDFLWPIVAIGGFGAFIDFLIGRTGQEKARGLLLKWWVRFDDVRWQNFGREEGLFAGRLIEKWFGQRIWSERRAFSACFVIYFFSIIGYIRLLISPHVTYTVMDNTFVPLGQTRFWCLYCTSPLMLAGYFFIFFVGFFSSISFTIFFTHYMSHLCGVGQLRNVLVFSMMLIMNYIILVVWFPFTLSIRNIMVFTIDNPQDVLNVSTFLIDCELMFLDAFAKYSSIFYPKIIIGDVTQFIKTGLPLDVLCLYATSYLPSLLRFTVLKVRNRCSR